MAKLHFSIPFTGQEIHLYLLLNFPQILFSQLPAYFPGPEEEEESDMPLRPWLEGIQEALEGRRADISHFFTHDFSLPEALLGLVPLDRGDLKTWLEEVIGQDEARVRGALLQAVWPQDRAFRLLLPEHDLEGLSPQEVLGQISQQASLWPSYLRQAGLSAQTSWLLLEILEEPGKYLSAYSALVNSFQFIAEAIVGPRESQARQNLEEALEFLGQESDRLLELNPSLAGFFASKAQETIPVMPSLDPLALRLMHGQEVLVMGFALADYLKAQKDKLQEDREARAAFCQTLADPTRYKLCCLLAQGQRRQKDLAASLDVSQATVSHHLAQLKALGLYKPGQSGGLAADSFLYYLNGLAEDLRIYG